MKLLSGDQCRRIGGYLSRVLAELRLTDTEHQEIAQFLRDLEEGMVAETDEREEAFRAGARQLVRGDEGSVEVDEHAVVSEGDDDGAYVQAWLWVSCEEARLPSKLDKTPTPHRRNPGYCAECGGGCGFDDQGEEIEETMVDYRVRMAVQEEVT